MTMRREDFSVVAAAFFTILLVTSPAVIASRAYIERGLETRTGTLDVIVTAHSSPEAAKLVRAAGGKVTSDLWIVNAVSGNLTARALHRLAADPRIISIVENKKVQSSDWNGWMSDLRMIKGQYTLTANTMITAAPTHLPNGGFAQITTNTVTTTSGELLIVNPDGSERRRVPLTIGGPFYSPAVADSSGRIFVGAIYGAMYAFDFDGNQLWLNTSMLNTTYFYPAPVIASDGTVIAVTYTGVVFGFDPASGYVRWQQSIARSNAGYLTAPVLGPDDTMYVSSNQGDIFAISPTGGVRWSAVVDPNARGNYAGFTPTVANGMVYVASGAKLVAFDAASGTQRFVYTADNLLLGSPVIAPDGGILIDSSNNLYSITPAGQVQWAIAATTLGSYFIRTPLVSADGSSIYVGTSTSTKKGGGNVTDYLCGFNRASGSKKWIYQTAAGVGTQTVLDADGGILFCGKNDTSFYRIGADGVQTHRIKAHASITDLSQSSTTGNILLRLNVAPQLYFCGRTPNAWNGKPDVQPGSSRQSWRLVYPYSIDIGADTLHKQTISGGTFIRGGDVGVAVVDSGVYWDPSTKQDLGVQLQHQFVGQADYVQTTCTVTVGCTQYPDYAFFDYNNSKDGYGHGTHVAGTISNKLTDEIVGFGQVDGNVNIGIAPDARILSVRVLGADGSGSYATVIKGIQYVVTNKATFGIRVMNLSLSAYATVPYFVDPLDRAVEKAWQAGIVVVAAAGNTGPFAQTITVPGNDPYVITAGALNAGRTAAFWKDDTVASWSATGPTFDGFAKPDLVAPGSQIVSYMYNGGLADPNTAYLVKVHPDYSQTTQLFRMNGTSMATAVTSGVVALMLQVNPYLTPDQVKYRLMMTARPALNKDGLPVYNTLEQGLGRIWAPDAVLSPVDPAASANYGLSVGTDLAHGYDTLDDLYYHFQGPLRRVLSDDGTAYLYYATDSSGNNYAFGVTDLNGNWLDANSATRMIWSVGSTIWAGGLSWNGNGNSFASSRMIWSVSKYDWSQVASWTSTRMIWSVTRMIWSVGLNWTGGQAWSSTRMIWSVNNDAWSSTRMIWSVSSSPTASSSSARWVSDDWVPPPTSDLPPPAGTNP